MDNDIKLKRIAAIYYKKLKFKLDYYDKKIYSEKKANNLIYDMVMASKPFMISRFGATELSCVNAFLKNREYTENIKNRVRTLSGIFPDTKENLDRFSKFYLECSKEVDVMAVWAIDNEKRIINSFCNRDIKLIMPIGLEPYYFTNPWSKSLENKKVLIVHPFEESIKNQYKKREVLFKNKQIIPKFRSLEVIKAVQSLAGNNPQYKDWFEAYEYMCSEINKKDFDVAIIGAGAYGLPLSSYVKKIGKQAIHMGGATQILFGIKGMRWDSHKYISKLYNDNWVRPTRNETPEKATLVEGGSYW